MNLQNIPRADKTIKRAFVPKLDAFLFFDYQQIELRLLAYYMAALGDHSMAQAIIEGKDLHTESTVAVLGLNRPPTEEERQIGKTLNFSIVYGGGRPTIVKQLGVGFVDAGRLLENYYRRWPGISLLNAAIANTLNTRGYIKTLWGRQLHPESHHKALNALVQGCASDLMKAALIKAHKYLTFGAYVSHLILTIHDELVLDALHVELEPLVEMIPRLMVHPPIHAVVPIGVDCEISFTTWADKEPYVKEMNGQGLAA